MSAELPETGERFEGLLPPVVAAPAFAIRKPAVAVFTLDDYVAAGIMSADQAQTLREAVASRANILVAGGTSTGKTTGGSQPGTQLSPVLYRTARKRRELLRIMVGQQNSVGSPRLTASLKPRPRCLDGHRPSRAFLAFLSGVPKCRHASSH